MHISKDAGVSLVLRIDNTLPLVENADTEAIEEACTLIISMAMRDRTGNIVSFSFQNLRHQKLQTLWDEDVLNQHRWELRRMRIHLPLKEVWLGSGLSPVAEDDAAIVGFWNL
ncbi:hypothetical protein Tco_1281779 [Tanacetum coccineum]